MERFKPLVTCQDAVHQSAPSYDSCKEIIDKMPWSAEDTIFGTAGQPGVQVTIPEQLISSKHSTFRTLKPDTIDTSLQLMDAAMPLSTVSPRQ